MAFAALPSNSLKGEEPLCLAIKMQNMALVRHTLTSKDRLKSKKLIDQVFAKGSHVFAHPFKAIYVIQARRPDEEPLIFGVSIPKKKIKSAVKRNLLKRRTREAYRKGRAELHQKLTDKGDIQLAVMLIFIEREPLIYSTIEKSVSAIMLKLTDVIPN